MQTKNDSRSTIDESKLIKVHEDDIKDGVFNCPDAVDSIEKNVFDLHENLITVVNLNKIKHIESGAFNGFPNLTTVIAPEAQTIGREAFVCCEELISIDMPKVTEVDCFAFEDCLSLTIVNAPQLQKVSSHAFIRCEKLVTLNLSKVEFLDLWTFFHCSQLTTLVLHPKVKIHFNPGETDTLNSHMENLKQVIIHNFDNTPFDESVFISQLPSHLKKVTITRASEIVENLNYAKKYLKQQVVLEDIKRQISALYLQLLFFPKTAQQSPKTIQKSSKTEEVFSSSCYQL